MRWLRSKASQAWVLWQSGQDPRIGTVLNVVRLDLLESSDPRDIEKGIILVANCEGCNAGAAMRWAQALKSRGVRKLYVISRSQQRPEAIQKIVADCRSIGVDARFLWDQTGRAHEELNAFFFPRCCLIGAGERIQWLQGAGDEIPASMSSLIAETRPETPMLDRQTFKRDPATE
jgi:hypothetical protein